MTFFLVGIIAFGIIVMAAMNRFGPKRTNRLDQRYFSASWTELLARVKTPEGMMLAVIDADMRLTYAQLRDRCQRLGGALASLGQQPVAVLAPNSHVLLEAHFGVPWAGVPLVTINTRLSADEVAYIVAHCEAGVLIYDAGLEPTARAVARQLPSVLLVRSGGSHDEYEEAAG